ARDRPGPGLGTELPGHRFGGGADPRPEQRPQRARPALAARGAFAAAAERVAARTSPRGARVARPRAGRPRHGGSVRRRPPIRRVGRAAEAEPLGAVKWIWVGAVAAAASAVAIVLLIAHGGGSGSAAPSSSQSVSAKLDRTTVDFADPVTATVTVSA